MKTQKPYLDEQTGERFAEPPSPLPLYLVYLPESNEDDLLSSVQAANFIERELRDGFVAGRVSRDAEVAELKAKIAELHPVEVWSRSWIAPHRPVGCPTCRTDGPCPTRQAVRGSASSPVEGGN